MRKGGDTKLSIFGRGLATRQMSATQSSNGILVYVYGDLNCSSDQNLSLQNYGHVYTAEQLCHMAAEQLHITPLAAPVFALWITSSDIWCSPNEEIVCSADALQEFVLRVRFIPSDSVISKLPVVDVQLFNYLFLQMRSDFINDRIIYREKALGQEYMLGLGVIDMVRYGKEQKTDLPGLRHLEPQDFIPVSAKGNFRFFWDKKRLQLNFWPHLQKEYNRYMGDNEVSTKLTYIKTIMSYAERYGMEVFEIPSDTSGSGIKIVVKPHGPELSGLFIYSGKEQVFDALFSDLMDISISEEPPGRVHINRKNGMPYVVPFGNRQKALSFVSLVDGYYRLQEDYHHHLCKDVESPLLTQLRRLRSHGPVSKEWATQRLFERYSRDPTSNFLLRQSEREFGGFALVCITPGTAASQPKAILLHIKRLPDGQYQLSDKDGSEPAMASMTELLEYYRRIGKEGRTSILLNKCVFPQNPLDSKIYLCRPDNKLPDDTGSITRQQRAPEVCLVSSVRCMELLGHGQFSEVLSSLWDKDSSANIEVAVKRLKEFVVHHQFYSQGVHKVIFWHHSTIVTTYAVCLATPLSLVMEKASLGALDAYLRRTANTSSAPRVSHLVLAAEQIAQALCYLEERNEAHGNIRCRNILLFRHEPKGTFTVKLGDVGLVYYYNTLTLSDPTTFERLPWIAPECYPYLGSSSSSSAILTLEADRYAFGITLWEMFMYGSRPYSEFDKYMQVENFVKQGRHLAKPENCPDDIYGIMKNCWEKQPEMREKSLVLIRNIRSLLTREGDIYNDYNDLQWLDRKRNSASDSQRVGVNGVGAGHDGAMSSSAALADNEVNSRLLMNAICSGTQGLHIDVTSDGQKGAGDTNGVVSPSSELSSISWGDDSRTPLIRTHNSAVSTDSEPLILQVPSPTLSAGDVSATPSDTTVTTELDNYGGSFSESPNSIQIEGRITAIQSRPLPQPPTLELIQSSRLQYDNSKPLGQGHYGEVLKGQYVNDDGEVEVVAIKRLKQSMYNKFVNEFEKEFRIMVRLAHPNIVRIIGQSLSYDSNTTMLLVMEFVSNGCLREYLKKNESRLQPADLLRFGREIAEGMVYLSSEKIVHRDLATRNVLVTHDIHMKISDFGLSRALDQERDYYRCKDSSSELPAPWCAPEALMTRKFSEKSDVWSFGITLWEIYSFGQLPHLCEIEKLPRELHQGKRLRLPKACIDRRNVYELMLYGCWQYYPEERKSFVEVLDIIKKIESGCWVDGTLSQTRVNS